ncbi:MAG: AbrB/MazE/SpoVT family DNA-binding domain-containing protein [Syntrophobacteraceae bacterium]
MKGQVKRWGNSLAIRIPAPVAEALGFRENVSVQLEIVNGRLTIEPVSRTRNKYTIAELVEGIAPDNIHPAVDVSGPVGNEVW